jgi:DNA repair protein RadC
MKAKSQPPASYIVSAGDDNAVIERALRILQSRVNSGPVMDSPRAVRDYLTLRAAGLQREVFSVMFLDSQHHVIETRDMFAGTLAQTAVYPREVCKAALSLNTAAVILSHNHPSGHPEPSRADEHLTATLKSALALIDVRVLDHVVTGGGCSVSMAERGLI